MNRTRLLIIVPSILVGTLLMAYVIVPLNQAMLDALTGERTRFREEPPPVDVAEVQRQELFKALEKGRRRPAQGVREEIRNVLEDLGNAIQTGNAQLVGEQIHPQRMVKAFRKAGVLKGLAAQDEPEFAARVVKVGVTEALSAEGLLPGWGQTEIRSVQMLAGGNEAVVIARHRDFNMNKMRWWLVRENGNWYVYDFEDMDITGIRLSSLLGSLRTARAGLPAVPREWASASTSLRDAAAAVRRMDYAGGKRILETMPKTALPPRLEALRWLLLATATVGQRNNYLAVSYLDKARALNRDMPYLDLLYAATYVQTGKAHQARPHLEKYRKLVGDDYDTLFQLGRMHARLGRAREAAAAFRKSLDDEPNLLDGLLELRRVLPHGGKGELTDRLARMAQPALHFEQLARDAMYVRDAEAVEAYVAALRRRDTRDSVVDVYEARAKAMTGKVGPAVVLFKKALANLRNDPVRKNYVRDFLLDLAANRDALQAYRLAPDRSEAFTLLAADLFNRRDLEALRKLIAAHRLEHRDDAWAHFYTGEVHADAKEYDAADRAFAAAQAGFQDQQARERARERRVWVRYRAGKWQAAYEEVGPRQATFRQLANLFVQARNPKGLQALLAVHRRHEAADPKLPLWEAEAAWLTKDYAAAAKLFLAHREGFYADPGHRFKFGYRLLFSLVKLGRIDEARKEAEAFIRREGPNRQEVHYTLNDLIRTREDEAVAVLAAAQRKVAPEDGEGLLWEARAAVLKDRLPEAGKLLRLALDRQTQALVRDRYLREFLTDTVAVGKPLEGYRLAPDTDRGFRMLGDALLNRSYGRYGSYEDDDFEDDAPLLNGLPVGKARALLRQLIQVHLDKKPGDAAAYLYMGELYRREGAYDRAVEAFARGMAARPSPELRQRFQYDQVEALFKAGKGLKAYLDTGRQPQTFVQLANLCMRDCKAKELKDLIAAHRQTDPDDPKLPVWETEAHYLAGEYAEALALLRKHRDGAFAMPSESWKYRDRVVRCLMRLKRFDEALKEARPSARERYPNLLLIAAVHAAAGDVAKTQAALEKCVRRYFSANSFYADPDLGPALCSEPFRALRERYPERLLLPLSEDGQRGPRF